MSDRLADVLGADAAHDFRRALAASSRSYWELGDMLVERLGPTPGSTHRDGSLAKMRVVAEGVGVEVHAVANWRVVATAWPESSRVDGVSWSTHRVLVTVPDRRRVLLAFVEHCCAEGVTPGRPRLEAWLATSARGGLRTPAPLVTVLRRGVTRVARLGAVDPATYAALTEVCDELVEAVAALEVEQAALAS